MFKSVLIGCAILFCISGTVSAGKLTPEVKNIIEKSKKALDPKDKSAKIKTMVMISKVEMPQMKIRGNMTITIKHPDKFRIEFEVPNMMKSVKVYNAKDGWECSNMTGLRKIQGKELAFDVFFLKLSNPKSNMEEMFESVTLDKNGGVIEGEDCVKLTCMPNKESGLKQPMVMYIAKNSYLTKKLTGVAETHMGTIPSETVITKYLNYDGIKQAQTCITRQMGMKLVSELERVQYNPAIPDTVFEKPKLESLLPASLKAKSQP